METEMGIHKLVEIFVVQNTRAYQVGLQKLDTGRAEPINATCINRTKFDQIIRLVIRGSTMSLIV